jgi:hypothetical protein
VVLFKRLLKVSVEAYQVSITASQGFPEIGHPDEVPDLIAYMKKFTLFFLLLSTAFLSGCSTTFAGSVVVITFGDIVFYVVLALLMAFFISLKRSSSGNLRRSFWLAFILSLLLTPLAGLIWLLILFSEKQN